MQSMQTINDANGQVTGVIIPIELWQKIQPHLLQQDITSTANIKQRPIGLAKDSFQVPQSFFDPLPDELLDAFEGKSSKQIAAIPP